ncbi:hypothetical protein [Pseudoxanthomonas kaohsiungensis]|uniref:Secreted protein n=1 Tax=Pseudoxanthomonas kaohsiungensis TaxID=283923 RepID=A0ABW3M2I6_9GAMM|nr:hypothetical protein [Pseudoxanthomonas kaohsiungensis]KAF1700823.1 hypothetical protein CSC66_14780 [Pseudoxanthomonas kaohsiungensis]
MNNFIAAVLLALALQAAPAGAQTLWKDARYGMSPAEVQARFPQARVPGDADELAGGEIEGLRLQDVDLAGHRFTAAFFFDGDALAQVTLSLRAPREGRVDLQVFEDVTRALVARHGAPAHAGQQDEPFERRRREWEVDGTRLALVLFASGPESLVNVIHQVGPPDAPPPVRLESGG